MSYQDLYASLEKCRQAAAEDRFDKPSLIDAIEQLVVVLESDLTQIKVALGHAATLLEERERS